MVLPTVSSDADLDWKKLAIPDFRVSESGRMNSGELVPTLPTSCLTG